MRRASPSDSVSVAYDLLCCRSLALSRLLAVRLSLSHTFMLVSNALELISVEQHQFIRSVLFVCRCHPQPLVSQVSPVSIRSRCPRAAARATARRHWFRPASSCPRCRRSAAQASTAPKTRSAHTYVHMNTSWNRTSTHQHICTIVLALGQWFWHNANHTRHTFGSRMHVE